MAGADGIEALTFSFGSLNAAETSQDSTKLAFEKEVGKSATVVRKNGQTFTGTIRAFSESSLRVSSGKSPMTFTPSQIRGVRVSGGRSFISNAATGKFEIGRPSTASSKEIKKYLLVGEVALEQEATLCLADPLECVEIQGVLKEIKRDGTVAFEHHPKDGPVQMLQFPPGKVEQVYRGNESEWLRRARDFEMGAGVKYLAWRKELSGFIGVYSCNYPDTVLTFLSGGKVVRYESCKASEVLDWWKEKRGIIPNMGYTWSIDWAKSEVGARKSKSAAIAHFLKYGDSDVKARLAIGAAIAAYAVEKAAETASNQPPGHREKHMIVCPSCMGSGKPTGLEAIPTFPAPTVCSRCNGCGFVNEERFVPDK